MGLTKSEAIANHRKMWNWIADETMKRKCKVEKWDYFKAHGITDIPSANVIAANMQEMDCSQIVLGVL